MGFRIVATDGRAKYLRARGVRAERVAKVHEGRPNAIDLIVSGEVHLLINTPLGKFTQADDYAIRRTALVHRVPYTTTMSAASAACDAIIALKSRTGSVRSLQEWHERTTVENRVAAPANAPPRGPPAVRAQPTAPRAQGEGSRGGRLASRGRGPRRRRRPRSSSKGACSRTSRSPSTPRTGWAARRACSSCPPTSKT